MARTATRHGGPIDPYSKFILHDFVDETAVELMDPQDDDVHFEFYGIHLVPQGANSTRFAAHLDGHVGTVADFDAADFDDVLELVDELMSIKTRWSEYEYQRGRQGDDYPPDELVEWAGKIMTWDDDRAKKHPDKYLRVPDDV